MRSRDRLKLIGYSENERTKAEQAMSKSRHPHIRNFLIAYLMSLILAVIFVASTSPNALTGIHGRELLVKVSGFIFLMYLSGSIPSGLIFTKLMMNTDVREVGSGNIGMTNVLRTGNKLAGVLTLVFDVLKGYLPLLLLKPHLEPMFSSNVYFYTYLLPVIGHMFPCWLAFKGGKGIATGFGVMLYFFWPLALIMVALWLVVAKLTKISSLGGLVAFGCFPLASTYFTNFSVSSWSYVMAGLVFYAHRDNIKRLLLGQENKFGDPSI